MSNHGTPLANNTADARTRAEEVQKLAQTVFGGDPVALEAFEKYVRDEASPEAVARLFQNAYEIKADAFMILGLNKAQANWVLGAFTPPVEGGSVGRSPQDDQLVAIDKLLEAMTVDKTSARGLSATSRVRALTFLLRSATSSEAKMEAAGLTAGEKQAIQNIIASDPGVGFAIENWVNGEDKVTSLRRA